MNTKNYVLLKHEGKRYTADLTYSHGMSHLIIENTSRCNLRCIYCEKSSKSHNSQPGNDMDMTPEVFEQALNMVRRYKPSVVILTGIGEPTFQKGWMDFCARLFAIEGVLFRTNTNLARLHSEQELDVLLGFEHIFTSIDTVDQALQKTLRKAVNVDVVVQNIRALRARAAARNMKQPWIEVNCVVSDQTVFGLLELAKLCVKIGVNQLNLIGLAENESSRQSGIRSVRYFSEEAMVLVKEEIFATRQFIKGTAMSFNVYSSLMQAIERVDEKAALSQGLTWLCDQPWSVYLVRANGEVSPCCSAVASVGQAGQAEDVLNNEASRAFRQRLITGDLPELCKGCCNGTLASKEDMMSLLAGRSLERILRETRS